MTSNPLLLEAIALKKCVSVTYNRTRMTLAPHILYTKFDAAYVDAIVVTRDGQPPKEKKLGAFNLAGLTDVEITDTAFTTDPLFEPAAEKYAGATLFAI